MASPNRRRAGGLMLDKMSVGHRIIVTVLIVMAILFALALFGFLTGGWDQAEGAQAPSGQQLQPAGTVVPPSPFDDRIAALDREAIDNAYRTQIEHLFAIWMKDETGQPNRAVTGAIQARKAYVGAMTEIGRREQQLRERREREKR